MIVYMFRDEDTEHKVYFVSSDTVANANNALVAQGIRAYFIGVQGTITTVIGCNLQIYAS